MGLAQLKKELSVLEEKIVGMSAVRYKTLRDGDGNLSLKFFNQRRIRLPTIQLRPYQIDVQRKLFLEGVRRLFLVWPRRSGKEVTSWSLLIQGALESPGLYLMIYPTNVRARTVLWDGAITFSDGSSLKFINMIPQELITKINHQEMSVTLINGSIIKVLGSDKAIDKLRGTNPRGAIYSEWAFSDPRVMRVLAPVFLQNKGWYMIQTTFNGLNHAYNHMQEVRNNKDWYCRIESIETLKDIHGNRFITDEMIEKERRDGSPEWWIQQEYYSSVELNQETLYFSIEIANLHKQKRIVPGLILHNKTVYSAWDLGMRDTTAILLFQLDDNGDPVIIYYTEGNNKKFEYYVEILKKFCVKNNLVLHSHYLPHDARNTSQQTGLDFIEFGRQLGEQCFAVQKPQVKYAAIQAMRQIFYRTKFNKENTIRLMDCLSNYSKEFDEKLGIYKEKPVHNWASHGVDAFQTMTLAIQAGQVSERRYGVIYYD